MDEAEQIAKESTPEALGLPTDSKGYDNVTAQVAAVNDLLDTMRLSGDEAGASDMLSKMYAAAQLLGGSLEVVDDKIVAIKDATGKDADWDFLANVINYTGLAKAKPKEGGQGIDILGLGPMNYDITFNVDPNGEAQLRINQLLQDSLVLVETRTINYKANGTIENIDILKANAEEPSSYERLIGYYTNGVLRNAALIRAAADGEAETRWIEYTTNGEIENII